MLNKLFNLVTVLLLQDKITWEQAVLALDNQNFIPDILGYMGLRPAKVKKERSLGDAINA